MSHTLDRTVTVSLVVVVFVGAGLTVQFDPWSPAPPPDHQFGDSQRSDPILDGASGPTVVGHSGPATASTPIDACRVVDSPGRYHLVTDLVSQSYTCLEIRADDVVLDGAGHALSVAESTRAYGEAIDMSTPGQFGEAIVLSGGPSNVTVTNLSFEGFDVGILSEGGSALTIRDVTGANTVTGILVDGVSDVHVASITVTGSAEDGIVVRNATDVAIEAVTAESNWFAGIVVSGSDRVSIDASTVGQNHGDGLFVHDSANVAVSRLVAAENAVGVLVIGADGTSVVESTLDRNELAGVAVLQADGVTVADSTISNTVGDPGGVVERTAGLLVIDARDTRLRDVAVSDNHEWTVTAIGSERVVAERLTAGSTVVSFTATDVAVDLASLDDEPCTARAANGLATEIGDRSTVTSPAGTLRDLTVTCVP